LGGELLSLACEGGIQGVQLSLLAGVVVFCDGEGSMLGSDSVVCIGDGSVLGADEVLEFSSPSSSISFEDGNLVFEDVYSMLEIGLLVLQSGDLDVWGWDLRGRAVGAIEVVNAIVLDFGDRVSGVVDRIALLVLVELVGRVILCFASVVILDLGDGRRCIRSLRGTVVCLRGDVDGTRGSLLARVFHVDVLHLLSHVVDVHGLLLKQTLASANVITDGRVKYLVLAKTMVSCCAKKEEKDALDFESMFILAKSSRSTPRRTDVVDEGQDNLEVRLGDLETDLTVLKQRFLELWYCLSLGAAQGP
jgi:hypothetical protein